MKTTLKQIALGWTLILLCLFSGNAVHGETQTDAAENPLSLEVFTICKNVVDRTPVGMDSMFSTNVGKLYCFTKVVGARTDTQITHNWFMNGKLKASITLPVQSAAWRTWSQKTIRPEDAGDWMVEVLNEAGEPIEAILFFVQ